MEIEILAEKKRVYIWLTKEEARDEQLKERLKPLYKKYKAKGYLTVVYESGTGDLQESIRELLIYNMYRSAEKQLEKERGAEFPTGNTIAGLLAMEHSLAAERRRKREEIQLKLKEGSL